MESLILLAVFAVLYAIMGVLMFIIVVYAFLGLAVLSLIQYIFGLIVKKITGDKPEWLFSKASFYIEIFILLALVIGYTVLPAHPVKVDAGECARVEWVDGTNVSNPVSLEITQPENIEALVNELEGQKTTHILKLSLKYMYSDFLENGRYAKTYYFYDESGEFIQKVCFYDDLIGVSSKKDGEFSYYNTKDKIDMDSLLRQISDSERKIAREAENREAFEALCSSFAYADGTYSFTVPEFVGDYWNLEIKGAKEVYTQTVVESSGYVLDTNVVQDTLYYLTEHTEAEDWQPGEQYSFTLDETTYRSVYCTVSIGSSEFEFDFPLTDEKYIADRDNPVIYYY